MAVSQNEIIQFCDEYLAIHEFKDYCPNGLQVEGDQREVHKIALGVSVSEKVIELANEIQADLILVHHGLIWNKDSRVIQGPLQRKLVKLLSSGMALGGYHLPLDFHPEVGNNIQLAYQFGLSELTGFGKEGKESSTGVIGTPEYPNIQDFASHIEKVLQRKPLVLPYGPNEINRVGIVTGGAQGYFLEAIEAGVDCFITGESSEYNFSMSQEYGVHFISAGHYQTERFGIQALGRKLQEVFHVETEFIEQPNPI